MKFLLISFCMAFATSANAGVRTLYTNDTLMRVVQLKMGRSTVLRFSDKPTKVVIGNSNYFKAEFVGNDITLQPTGVVSSNMFVYTEYGRVFGLLLSVTSSGSYDDLVNVKWGFGKPQVRAKPKVKPPRELKLKATIGETLSASDFSVLLNDTLGLHFVDFTLKNQSKEPVSLKPFTASVTRSNEPLELKSTVIRDDSLAPNAITKVRIIVRLKQKRGFTVHMKLGDEHDKVIVPRSAL